MTKTSIIIPNYNGADRTASLLSRLLRQTSNKHEFIVVDDGSSDDSVDTISRKIARLRNVRLISQNNKGRSAARNVGASAASGNLLLFLDNDVIPPDHFIERVEYVHSIRKSAWITGNVVQDIKECEHKDVLLFRRRLDHVISPAKADSDGLIVVNSFTTAQLAVCRHVFFTSGGFDESLRDCEDFELSVRVVRSGGTILHDTQNTIRHADYSDLSGFIRRQVEYRQARAELGRMRPDLLREFPELFVSIHDCHWYEKGARALFRYNWFWRSMLSGPRRRIFPPALRIKLYAAVAWSEYLCAAE